MILLSITLVVISTVLSLAYKYLKDRPIEPTHLSKTTIAHALAIEAIQLTLAIIGSIIGFTISLLSPSVLYSFKIVDFDLYISTWLAAFGTLAIYALAILTIDIIDSLIQLGSCRHPIQLQTFLLTRRVLLPGTVIRRCSETEESPRGRSRTPKALNASMMVVDRAARSEPATPTRLRDIGVQFPSETRNALVRGRTGERTISMPEIVRGLRKTESPCSTAARPFPTVDLNKLRGSKQEAQEVLQTLSDAFEAQNANAGKEFTPANILGIPSPRRSHSASLPSVPSSIGSVDVDKMSTSWDNVTLELSNEKKSPPSFGSSSVGSSLGGRPRQLARQRDGLETDDRIDGHGSPVRSMSGSMVKETAKMFEKKM